MLQINKILFDVWWRTSITSASPVNNLLGKTFILPNYSMHYLLRFSLMEVFGEFTGIFWVFPLWKWYGYDIEACNLEFKFALPSPKNGIFNFHLNNFIMFHNDSKIKQGFWLTFKYRNFFGRNCHWITLCESISIWMFHWGSR